MSAVNVRSKTDRKYLIQVLKNGNWIFSPMDKIQGGFSKPNDAREKMEEVMVFHNDFVGQNYRLVERTTIIIDEPLDKFSKGW